jgi:hypothetical protein
VDSRDFLDSLSLLAEVVDRLPKQDVMVFQNDIFMQGQDIVRSEILFEKFEKARELIIS